MAYETGTATDIDDLINVKLKAFAQTAGWNVNDDNWPDHLALSKGGCYVSLRKFTTSFTDSLGSSRTDHRIWAAIASGYDGAGGTANARWIAQPDNLITSSSTVGLAVQSNDYLGPFTSYHLFSGAVGDKDYIYLVAEADAGFFTHFYFGQIDDLGFAFDPPLTFVTATYWKWWPSSAVEISDVSLQYYSTSHFAPFDSTNVAQHVYSEGIIPSRPVVRTEFADVYKRDIDGYHADYWLSHVIGLGPNPINGVTPLYSIPFIPRSFASSSIHRYGGVLPNLRLCGMSGRTPKEVIVLGSDNWMIFPMRKQSSLTNVVRPPFPGIDNTSYQAAFAIKKIV